MFSGKIKLGLAALVAVALVGVIGIDFHYAIAQNNVPTQPAGGPQIANLASKCSGTLTLSAGVANGVLTNSSNTSNGTGLAGACINQYHNIACVQIAGTTVGAAPATPANTGVPVYCYASPTVTFTAGMAATATQTAIYAVAASANATPKVVWWGVN